jgi:hypothetical protein
VYILAPAAKNDGAHIQEISMARVMLTRDPELPYFYNVDRAVGPGCPNARDDVLLVQYLMKIVFDNLPNEKPPGAPLQVDGVAGEITFRYIKRVQEMAKQKGVATQTVDGRVDKAVGSGVGARTGSTYTILNLCAGYQNFRRRDYGNIGAAGDCPRELAALFTLS